MTASLPPCVIRSTFPDPVCEAEASESMSLLNFVAFFGSYFPSDAYQFYPVKSIYPALPITPNDSSLLGQLYLREANLTIPFFVLHAGRLQFLEGFVGPVEPYELSFQYNYRILQPQFEINFALLFPKTLIWLLLCCLGCGAVLSSVLAVSRKHRLGVRILQLMISLGTTLLLATLEGHLALLFTRAGTQVHPLSTFEVTKF